MLGNFTYYCPTRMYFGDKAQKNLPEALKPYGKKLLLIYGGGSIKRNGIYEDIRAELGGADKEVIELPGVNSNPTLEKYREGLKAAKEHHIDFILAVGGGSTIDYAKAVGVGAAYGGDPWQRFFVEQADPEPDQKIIPVGAVLTVAGTGSETNGTAVLTDPSIPAKIGKVFDYRAYPRFAIMNPRYTFSVPKHQLAAGTFDTMSHVMEQYFSGDDDSTTDYLAEGLMRNIVESGLAAAKNPEDYEARSNLMWDATWALNPLMAVGKPADWMAHMMSHAVGAYTHGTHGMILSSISVPYYRFIMDFGIKRFARFAKVVWDVDGAGKSDREMAEAGLNALHEWILEIGAETSLSKIGMDRDMINDIASLTISSMNVQPRGYRKLGKEDVMDILAQSL